MRDRLIFSLCLLLCLAALGCGTAGPPTDSRAFDRISAFRKIVAEKDSSGIPLLITGLTDEDEAVRMFAAKALKEMTGRDVGYRADMPPDLRVEKADLYIKWLREKREKSEKDGAR